MEKYKFYEKINVYKNPFKNLDETFSFIKNTEKETTLWESWYVYGTQNKQLCYMPEYKQVSDEIYRIFDEVIRDYVNEYNYENFIISKSWQNQGFIVCKYNQDQGITDSVGMNYHTDYQTELSGQPGWKFGFTVTMYLNDDYENGGVDFYIKQNDEVKYYKPKAGDVVVFPSGSPDIEKDNLYLHGVRISNNNPKYFIRMFYFYWQNADEQYLADVEKYGFDQLIRLKKDKAQIERTKFFQENSPKPNTKFS
jgi:hypothetical protein